LKALKNKVLTSCSGFKTHLYSPDQNGRPKATFS